MSLLVFEGADGWLREADDGLVASPRPCHYLRSPLFTCGDDGGWQPPLCIALNACLLGCLQSVRAWCSCRYFLASNTPGPSSGALDLKHSWASLWSLLLYQHISHCSGGAAAAAGKLYSVGHRVDVHVHAAGRVWWAEWSMSQIGGPSFAAVLQAPQLSLFL